MYRHRAVEGDGEGDGEEAVGNGRGLSRTFASWHITIHEMQFRSKRKRTQSH